MKHFIQAFKQSQTDLLNEIKTNGLPVGLVNGIPSAQHGISFSEAQEIIKNQKAYLKESGQFTGDETKVVVSKKLFRKYLETNHKLNLFLLGRLDGNAKSWLTMESKKAEAIEKLVVPKMNFAHLLIIGSIFSLGLKSSLFFFGYLQYNLGVGEKTSSLLIAILCFVICFFSLYVMLKRKKEYKKAKKEKYMIQGEDFFMYGHDADDTRGVDQYKGCNMSFSFPNMPNYQNMVTTALSLGGKIGYIFRRDTSVDIDFDGHHLNCRGPVMPCIILKESILFDVAYLHIIDGFIMKQVYDMDCEDVPYMERKNEIPHVYLTPEMFI